MDLLKLGLLGLPQAEVRLIAILFRLHSVEPSFIWTLPPAAPFDALLVDASVPEHEVAPLRSTGTQIIRLSAPGRENAGEMPRPIRSDRLISWLNGIEVGLLHGERDGHSISAGHAVTATSSHEPAVTSAPTVARPPAAEPAPLNLSDQALTFKLKRWPPSNLVEKDVNRIRLATVLSRKPISLKELGTVSRVGDYECRTFIQDLARLDLLFIDRRIEKSPEQALLAEFPLRTETPKPVAKKGGFALISSIRRRFGLI
ncbi:MAG: hypothetical protein R3E42_15240 [Burkholderiaceae bacterium]